MYAAQIYSLPPSQGVSEVLTVGVADAAIVIVMVEEDIVVGLDAAVGVVDTAVTVVVGLDAVVVMVDMAVAVAGGTEDGARIAATIAGMSSVVKGRGAVVERRLRFGGGGSGVPLPEF